MLSRPPLVQGVLQELVGHHTQVRHVAEQRSDVCLGHLVEQPIGAQQEAVAWPNRVDGIVDIDRGTGAERTGEDVAVRVISSVAFGDSVRL